MLVVSTASSPAEAKQIAQGLLKKRLAACVNLVPNVQSWYWWQGAIESSSEILLLIKTVPSCLKDLSSTLKKYHSYDVPEIITLPIFWGDQVYLQWLKKSTKEP